MKRHNTQITCAQEVKIYDDFSVQLGPSTKDYLWSKSNWTLIITLSLVRVIASVQYNVIAFEERIEVTVILVCFTLDVNINILIKSVVHNQKELRSYRQWHKSLCLHSTYRH